MSEQGKASEQLTAPSASAATSATATSATAVTSAELPSLEAARSWIGMKLEDIGGGSAGKVEGLFVDAESKLPIWTQIRLGRFGHRSLIPFEHCVEAGGRVWTPYDRDLLRGAPRVDPDKGLTRQQEVILCAYFEIPETTGRAGRIASRSADTVTTRPG